MLAAEINVKVARKQNVRNSVHKFFAAAELAILTEKIPEYDRRHFP